MGAVTFRGAGGGLKETARWTRASCDAERRFASAAWTSPSEKREGEPRSEEFRKPRLSSTMTCLEKERQTVSLLLKDRLVHRFVSWEVRNASVLPPDTNKRSNFALSPSEDTPGTKSFKVVDQRSNQLEAWREARTVDSIA